MKLTVPHMGNCYIALESLLQEMGHEVVLPPPCSKRTLNLGTKHSPESACLPLKLNVGNFLEALELGAEGIIMAGGSGPCRFGLYAQVQREILADMGKEAELIVLEPPRENLSQLTSQLRRLFAVGGMRGFWRGMVLAWHKLKAVEELEQAARYARPRQAEVGQVNRQLSSSLEVIRQASGVQTIRHCVQEESDKLLNLAIVTKERIRVGLVGEIYTVIEPFVNVNLEDRLGDLGVDVTNTISMTHWVKNHVIKNSVKLYSDKHLRESAQGYLRGFVGGHGLESVAHTVDLARQGYDGVIHIFPFTCMPEIVAQSVIAQVRQDFQIPILTLVVDEHTGEAGFQTRLEAFVDMIQRSAQNDNELPKEVLTGETRRVSGS